MSFCRFFFFNCPVIQVAFFYLVEAGKYGNTRLVNQTNGMVRVWETWAIIGRGPKQKEVDMTPSCLQNMPPFRKHVYWGCLDQDREAFIRLCTHHTNSLRPPISHIERERGREPGLGKSYIPGLLVQAVLGNGTDGDEEPSAGPGPGNFSILFTLFDSSHFRLHPLHVEVVPGYPLEVSFSLILM